MLAGFRTWRDVAKIRIQACPTADAIAHKFTSTGRPKNSASCAGKHMRGIDIAYA
jgi:hypothetical protein